jgi:MYXO-CTERM domain-containing protein
VAQVTGRTLPTWFVDEDLVDGDEYWWVARANDGHGTGQDSNHGHFTVTLPVTNRPPTDPGISAPAAGAVVADTTPGLVVTNATDPDGDTLTYFFEVASNLAFSGASLQVSAAVAQGTGTTSWTVPAALAEDTVYYWRCRAFDGVMAGEWVVGSFRIDAANGAPTAPVPLTPADGSMLLSGPTRLVAQNGLDPEGAALTYKFEIGSSVEMTTILGTGNDVVEGDGATAWTVAGVNFEKGQTYYWRVTASDGVNNVTSAVVSFSIYEPVPVEPTPEGGCGGCGCSTAQPSGDFAMLLLGMGALILIRRRRSA